MGYVDVGDIANSGWATLVLGIVAIVVTIWLSLKLRSRSKLAINVSVTSIVDVHSEARGRVEISYEGKPIQDAHLLEFLVINSGNMSIREADFERGLAIVLNEGAAPLTYEVSDAEPPELKPVLSADGNRVRLEPLLLNPGDRVQIKLLVRDYESFQLDYRIAGVGNIDVSGTEQRSSWIEQYGERLERIPLPLPFAPRATVFDGLAAVIAVGLIIGAVSLLDLSPDDPKTDSTVSFKRGGSVCGEVRDVGSQRAVVQVTGSGKILSIPLNKVASIEDDSC